MRPFGFSVVHFAIWNPGSNWCALSPPLKVYKARVRHPSNEIQPETFVPATFCLTPNHQLMVQPAAIPVTWELDTPGPLPFVLVGLHDWVEWYAWFQVGSGWLPKVECRTDVTPFCSMAMPRARVSQGDSVVNAVISRAVNGKP